MNVILQEIIRILTTPPGNLTYHLVLAFSIVGAFQSALSHWRTTQFPQGRRMVNGLVILLVLRLTLFLLAGIAWQGLLAERLYLPPIERGLALISTLIIIWLWAFPEPSRPADAATTILGLLSAAVVVLGMVWWGEQEPGLAYNGSWADSISETTAIAILVIGVMILLVRRPNGWGYGAAMLLVALAGHVLYFASFALDIGLSRPQGDYPGLVRLAQMVAYPMLLILPQRFPAAPPAARSASPAARPERRRFGVDPKLLDDFLSLSAEEQPETICQIATRAIAHTMLADLSLLLSTPDSNGDLILQCGYDLIREEQVQDALISGKDAALLTSAAARGLPLRLPSSSTSTDLRALARALHIERAGHLLAAPVIDSQGSALCVLVLLSPYSNRAWTAEEQALLSNFTRPLARLLQRRQQMSELAARYEQSQQTLQSRQHRSSQLETEYDELQTQLQAVLDELSKQRAQAEGLAAIIAAQEKPQAEDEQVEARSRASGALWDQEKTEPGGILGGELRLALEEVARLQSALQEAERNLEDLPKQMDGAVTTQANRDEIAAIVQELRQPMASVMGYTEFLMGESLGILGTLQRKFLDRISMSIERMSMLVDDLVRLSSPGVAGWRSLPVDKVDLLEVIRDAEAQLRQQMPADTARLQMQISDRLPPLPVEREALHQVIASLLENAAEVSPADGEIALNASLEGDEHQQQFILLQVSDQGGGIPAEQMHRVFSRYTQAEGRSIPGTAAKGSSLAVVHALVEKLGGRIWVDSVPGTGSTFSVLLPLSNGNSPESSPSPDNSPAEGLEA